MENFISGTEPTLLRFHKILCLILLASILFCFIYRAEALTIDDFINYSDYKKFDCDDDDATIETQEGYTSLLLTDTFSAGVSDGYVVAAADDRNRGVGSNLTRDFHFKTTTGFNFSVNVETSEYYEVTVYCGDTTTSHDKQLFYFENTLVFNITNPLGYIVSESANITVSDGVLDMYAVDGGGSDNNCVFNGLDVRKGVLDSAGWLQYQIDNLPTPEPREFTDEDIIGLIILFFSIAFCAGLILFKKK